MACDYCLTMHRVLAGKAPAEIAALFPEREVPEDEESSGTDLERNGGLAGVGNEAVEAEVSQQLGSA